MMMPVFIVASLVLAFEQPSKGVMLVGVEASDTASKSRYESPIIEGEEFKRFLSQS